MKTRFMKTLIVLSLLLVSLFSTSVFAGSESAKIGITFLNQDPDPAEPGEYLELRWKVQKTGNLPVEDLKFELQPQYPFSFDEGNNAEVIVGNWYGTPDAEEFYTLYYKVRVANDALEDVYDLKLRYKSAEDDGWTSQEYEIRVGENTLPDFAIGTLITSPVKLVSDLDEAKLDVEIQNIGDGKAENVIVELKLPEGFAATYGYSDRANLGIIESGVGKTASFYVDLDEGLIGQEYDAQIVINYKDDDSDEYQKVTLPFAIPVKDKPDFNIESVTLSPENPMPGDKVELKLVVKNVGQKDGEAVSVRAFKEFSQPFDFDEKSDFVGRLNVGEEGQAVLAYTIDEVANAKDYIIDLEIRSIADGEVIVEDESVKVNVAESPKGLNLMNSQFKNVFVLLAFGIVSYISFKIGKGNSSKKKR